MPHPMSSYLSLVHQHLRMKATRQNSNGLCTDTKVSTSTSLMPGDKAAGTDALISAASAERAKCSLQNGICKHLLDVAHQAQTLERKRSGGQNGADVPSSNEEKGSVSTKVVRGQGSVTTVHSPRGSSGEANIDSTRRNAACEGPALTQAREAGHDEDECSKKSRLVWNDELHHRFLHAVATIGLRQAVPKSIMQVMKTPGLTRENVASHLQKYRMYLKRKAGISASTTIEEHHWARLQAAQAEHLESVAPRATAAHASTASATTHLRMPTAAAQAPLAAPLHPAALNQASVPLPAFATQPPNTSADPASAVLSPAWAASQPLFQPVPGLATGNPPASTVMSLAGLPPGMLLPPPDSQGIAIGIPMPFPMCMNPMMASQGTPETQTPEMARRPSHTSDAAHISWPTHPAGASIPLPGNPASLMPLGFKPDLVETNLQLMRQQTQSALGVKASAAVENKPLDTKATAIPAPDADQKASPAAAVHAAAALPVQAQPAAPAGQAQPQLVYIPCQIQPADAHAWSARGVVPLPATQPMMMLKGAHGAMPQMMFSVSMAAYQACQTLPDPVHTLADGKPCKAESSLSTAPASASKDVSSQHRRVPLETLKRSHSDIDSPRSAQDWPDRDVIGRRRGWRHSRGASRRASHDGKVVLPEDAARRVRARTQHDAPAPSRVQSAPGSDEQDLSWSGTRRRQPRGALGLGVLAAAAAAVEDAGF